MSQCLRFRRFGVVACAVAFAVGAEMSPAGAQQCSLWAEAPDHLELSDVLAENGGDAGVAAQLSTLQSSVEKGAYGLDLVAPISYQISSPQVRLTAYRVSNTNPTRTSGTLRLRLWFAQSGYRMTGYPTAIYQLGFLMPNHYFPNVNSGLIPFSSPPSGCYYVSMLLEEYNGSGYPYVDYADFTNRVAIGSGSCSPGGGGACVPDSHTACMLNSRFRVTVRFRSAFDDGPVDTDALLKPVSGFASSNYETAFFYFNSANNIEMMVKMLDQGNVNGQGQPTIAVLFGVATPLRIEVTLFDTVKGTTKTYTSSFQSMQGATDFTAFVK